MPIIHTMCHACLVRQTSNMEQIAVYVADEEAQKFLLFQQYYEPFTVLLDSGVFNIRNGSAILHFDNEGTLQAINRADVLYSRRHTSLSTGA